ncbi:ASTRA complex subunit [Mortierella claussenii]|nr:ASTRA complex subunit [Mortierella claussenii]
MGYPSASLEPLFRLPVNALNFCKMSILAIDASPPAEMSSPTAKQLHGTEKTLFSSLLSKTHQHIYVAVPSPTTATLIDVYDIVKPERTFAAVGAPQAAGMASATIEGGGENRKWGSVMAIQLFQQQGQSLDSSSIPLDTEAEVLPSQLEGVIARALSMLVGYEDGSVALFKESAFSSTATADEGKKYKRKMDTLWTIKCHRDSVLALNVSSDFQFAMSSGSDNVLVKYDLTSHLQGVPEVQQAVLKSNGIADIKIRNDNKVLGLAGWDGSLRVYSVKTLKPLAILKYHREGLYGLAFALIHQQPTSIEATAIQGGGAEHEQADREAEAKEKDHGSSDHESEDDTDEDDSSDLEDALEGRRQWSTRHWIATGGKENRISLWEIY